MNIIIWINLGKTVMRLSAYIVTVIFVLILAVVYIVNRLWLQWLNSNTMMWVLIIGIIIIVIQLLLGAILIPGVPVPLNL